MARPPQPAWKAKLADFKKQALSPARASPRRLIFTRRPVGRTLLVSQVDCQFDTVRQIILAWARSKWPEYFTHEVLDSALIDVMEPGLHLQSSFAADREIWGGRFEHLGEHGITWVTEVMLANHESRIILGVSNAVSAPGDVSIPMSMPRFVRHLCERGLFGDAAWAVSDKPYDLEANGDGKRFFDFVTSPARRLPIVLLSRTRSGRFPMDGALLAREFAGLAHVVRLDPDVNRDFTAWIGRSWSAFDGSVRVYRPHFAFQDARHTHPFILGRHLQEFHSVDGDGAEGYRHVLRRMLYGHSVSVASTLTDFPTYRQIERASALDSARQVVATPSQEDSGQREELIALLEATNSELEEERDSWKAIAEDAERRREEAQARVLDLESKVAYFRHAMVQKSAADDVPPPLGDAEGGYPTDYAALVEWVEGRLAGGLVLHPRARRSLLSAKYEDPARIAEVIDLLAGPYRDSRILQGEPARESKERYLERARELGFTVKRSISENQASEYGDTYFVDYKIGNTTKQLLEWHLVRGNARDPRHCARIYYFWDAERRVVVVGGAPEHLENQLT